jgi:photosystem II stability/assembly factor-like uncharacterized protein
MLARWHLFCLSKTSKTTLTQLAALSICLSSTCLLSAAEYEPATADAEVLNPNIVTRALFTDIVSTDTASIAVGERGHILKSSDLVKWVQLPVPTRSVLTNVYARGSNLWAVGHEEVIVHSQDGGSTWTRQHVMPDAFGPLLDVFFLDDSKGFAIGAEGKMLTTSDAGITWVDGNITDRLAVVKPKQAMAQEQSDAGLASDDIGEDETPPHLNGAVVTNAGIVIVGETGAIFRSTDAGESWARMDFPYNGPMFGAIRMEDDSIIAYGLNGNIFQTRDLATTWTKLESNTDTSLMGGLAIAGNRAVFVGSRGSVLLKPADSDALKSFTFSDGGILAGVVSKSDSEFTLVGENGIFNFSPK